MKDSIASFFFGILVGLLFAVFLSSLQGSWMQLAKDAVQQCEKSLPRDQHCKVIAVPADKE